jgi:uncharacterized membrane protein YfcA
MPPWPVLVAAGVAIGTLTGFFGVGGSSLGAPVLALLGVPTLLAIASPVPATVPAALAAVVPYLRDQAVHPGTAEWTLLGAVPTTIVGALLSGVVGGGPLGPVLVVSGVVLVIVGWRVLQPTSEQARALGASRRRDRPLLVAASAVLGLFTGLLANGGGFLLVPMYLIVFGLTIKESAGTSLMVIAVLTVPTLATHWALGHIDWAVAGAYAIGVVPSADISARLAQRIQGNLCGAHSAGSSSRPVPAFVPTNWRCSHAGPPRRRPTPGHPGIGASTAPVLSKRSPPPSTPGGAVR